MQRGAIDLHIKPTLAASTQKVPPPFDVDDTGDRLDLTVEGWRLPPRQRQSTAAIGSVVGSFAGAGAANGHESDPGALCVIVTRYP